MILIDKATSTNRIVVTVTENTTVENPVYSLHLESGYTNKSFSLALPANTSTMPGRFDEFIVSTSLFQDIEPGFLTYTITEASDGIVERGMLKVVDQDNSGTEYISLEGEEADDDFIVYQG